MKSPMPGQQTVEMGFGLAKYRYLYIGRGFFELLCSPATDVMGGIKDKREGRKVTGKRRGKRDKK